MFSWYSSSRNDTMVDKILKHKHAQYTINKIFLQHNRSTILSYKQENISTARLEWNERDFTTQRELCEQLVATYVIESLITHYNIVLEF